MTDRKKVDIYSLYKKEKKIVLEDNENNFIEILLVKMTQGQRIHLFQEYNEFFEKEKQKLRAREAEFNSLALSFEKNSKEDFATGIISFEKAQRAEIADLYPALEGKTEEEKKSLLEEEFKKFETSRRDELLKKSDEEIREQFLNLTIEAQALIESARILNFKSLVYMCRDVETKEQIFKSIEDIESLTDRRIIDRLISEMLEFRASETAKEVRKIASSDESFLPAGESLKSSTDSPVTTA